MESKSLLSRLVSCDIQDRLIQLGLTVSDSYWDIGDQANIINEQIDALKIRTLTGEFWTPDNLVVLREMGYMDVYRFVGELCGKPARTVRYYSRVACFFDEGIRRQFAVLPFSHFAFAISFGDRAREILQKSLEQIEHNGGKPPSVEWLEINFTGISQVNQDSARVDSQNEFTERIWFDPDGTGNLTEITHQAQPETPEPDTLAGARVSYTLKLIARAIRPIESYVQSVDVPGPVRSALKILIEALREALTHEGTGIRI